MRDEITSIQRLGFALTEAVFFYGLVAGLLAQCCQVAGHAELSAKIIAGFGDVDSAQQSFELVLEPGDEPGLLPQGVRLLADLAVGRVDVVGECGVAGRHTP